MAYNMGDAIGYVKLNISDFEANANTVISGSKGIEKEFEQMQSITITIGKIIADVLEAIAQKAVEALTSVVEAGSQYQAAMSQVAATMSMTAQDIANNSEEYQKLSNAAKEMGATTKYSATQAAEALNYLALAGYSVDESITMLPKILNVAAAGGMDLARASDMVTDAMSALGLSLDEADMFIDKLAKTSQKSNTSVSQLGEAILQIGGTAKILSGGVTELNTALGILANNGIKATEGGTGLRQILNNLTAPTQKAAGLMEQLGFSMYDTSGKIKPLNQAFSELDDILKSMSDQEQQEILSTIFDARHLKSARALLAGYGETWDELASQIENANGAAETMAETMQENLTGAVTIAKSAIEGVQITAFEALEKGLTKSVKTATTSIDKLNKTLQTPEMQEALKKIGDMIGEILIKFAEFLAQSAIPKMIEWFSKLDDTAEDLKAIFSGLLITLPLIAAGFLANKIEIEGITAAQIKLKIATLEANAALLANPYVAAAVAVGVLTAAVVKLVEGYKRAQEESQYYNEELEKLNDKATENRTVFEESAQQAEELTHQYDEQVNEINSLVSQLGEYANKEKLSNKELATAQTIIERLNELYPENTAYIRDGQVVAYDELSKSVEEYAKQLYNAALIEGNKERLIANQKLIHSTKELIDEQNELISTYSEKWETYNSNLDAFEKDLKEVGREQAVLNASAREGVEFTEIEEIRAWYKVKQKYTQEDIDLAVQSRNEQQKILDGAKKDFEDISNETLQLRQEAGDKTLELISEQGERENAALSAAQKKGNAIVQNRLDDVVKTYEGEKKIREAKIADVWDSIGELDKKYQIGQIEDEKEYQRQRKELLKSIWDENNEDWVKEYAKSVKYDKQQLEKAEREKEQEDNKRKQKAEQVAREEEQTAKKNTDRFYKEKKRKFEADEKYTAEMYFKDLQDYNDQNNKKYSFYQDYCDKIEDEQKQHNEKVQQEAKKAAEKEFNEWTKKYNNLTTEANKAYQDIEKSSTNLTNQLLSGVKLYETSSKRVWDKAKMQWKNEDVFKPSVKGMKEQQEANEKYIKSLQNLEGKVSENVMKEILGMNEEDARKYVEALSKMSDSELKEYSNTYDKIYKTAEDFSDKYYKKQINEWEKKYKKLYDDLEKSIPSTMNLVGQDTIDGFIEGLDAKKEETTGKMNSIFSGSVDNVKKLLGIHSPSTVFEEIGENTLQGFINGIGNKVQNVLDVFSTLGEKSGQNFADGFKTIWDKFITSLQSDIDNLNPLNNLVDSINLNTNTQAQLQTSFDNYGNKNNRFIEDYNNNKNSNNMQSLTKQDIVNAIKEAMPDGDCIFKIDDMIFARASRKSLNMLAQTSGNLNLKS